jgi:predicted RNA-binding protein (virulence factor B family)
MKKQAGREPRQSLFRAGMIVSLIVSRKTEYGYFLEDAGTGILLHRNEATKELQVGDEATVFLYLDSADRLTATMRMPIVREGEYGWLEVVSVSPKLGVFLHNGISKDLLVFVDDLPKWKHEWPQVGDHLLVTMKRDRNGRLLAKPANEEVILEISVPAGKEMLNKWVEGTVYKVLGNGALLFTDEEHILFIHRDEMTEHLRLGQTVRCRVSFVRDDGRLNGSMRARKEQQYGEDADKLLRYLAGRGGSMPYTDDTPPDIIKQKFGISKSAFKRAMGKLLKERLVEQQEGWTHMNKELIAHYTQEEATD